MLRLYRREKEVVMKQIIVSIVVFALLCCSAAAQKSSQPVSPNASAATRPEQDAKRAEIRKLIELTGAANVSADALRQIIAPLRSGFPQVPDAFWDSFVKEVRSDELIDLVVPIYDKYYTLEEIRDLTRFYQSPVGQKTIKVLPKLSAEAIDAGQEWGRLVADRAMRKLKDKGYDKTSSLIVVPSEASLAMDVQQAREESVARSVVVGIR
ncbi:MAG: DUF2059 domain-containing protein [Terriglobales bacterium]|jgi:hypothetical protein